MVSSLQNSELLLLHVVLASNGLDASGFLTISKYMHRCYMEVLLIVGLRLQLAIALFRVRFPSGSPHKSLDGLLLSFRGSEGSSDVFFCTNMAEVV